MSTAPVVLFLAALELASGLDRHRPGGRQPRTGGMLPVRGDALPTGVFKAGAGAGRRPDGGQLCA